MDFWYLNMHCWYQTCIFGTKLFPISKIKIKAVESIYDCIMDLLSDAKVTAIENYNNENLLNDK